jgi:hypothetical protein
LTIRGKWVSGWWPVVPPPKFGAADVSSCMQKLYRNLLFSIFCAGEEVSY